MDPEFDKIIELGAVRVQNGIIVEEMSTLVNPKYEVSKFITDLTGITNEMLFKAPTIDIALPSFLAFISDSVVVGHNVHFDVNFLYDKSARVLDIPFSNDFVDTMRLSRRLLPELPHHRLSDMVAHFGISQESSHRSISDCKATISLLNMLLSFPEELLSVKAKQNLRAANITATHQDFDESHPLYGKVCVFTGALEKMVRKDAMQTVVNLGGICGDSVTKKTNFLILGNNDFCKSIKDGKSSKQKKAEQLQLAGHDIQVISENVFYDLIDSE